MHRHRDKDRTAPFISNGEATSQNEQWHERREMGVRSREKQRVRGDSEKTAKIAPDYPVEKKPKKKFLNHGRDPLKSSTMFCLLESLPKRLCVIVLASEIKG